MPFERWGSLSVDDHIDPAALVANVLLYDRLVVPVMTEQLDRNERAYWAAQGWDPDLQSKRLEQLRPLVVERPWNAERRKRFSSRFAQIEAERDDARIVDSKELTRRILAQEQVVEGLPGVDRVTVVAAYNSAASAERDFPMADAKDHLSAVGAAASAALSLIQFVKMDRRPAIEAGVTEPAAMFHDIEVHVGLQLL